MGELEGGEEAKGGRWGWYGIPGARYPWGLDQGTCRDGWQQHSRSRPHVIEGGGRARG